MIDSIKLEEHPYCFPNLSPQAEQSLELAKSREEWDISKEKIPKDTKAFWYLLGYWAGQIALQSTNEATSQ